MNFAKLMRPAKPVLATTALCLAFVLGAFVNAPPRAAVGQAGAGADDATLIALYRRIIPSVVSIDVRIPDQSAPDPLATPDPSNPIPPFSEGNGTGFILDSDGHIITNSHVVLDADRVQVTFADDITVTATVLGIDRDSDLAVLKVETDKARLIPLTLADSDQLQVGQHVIAIGNQFGSYPGSMTEGIISGLNRRFDSQAVPRDARPYQIPGMVQTDAAINPGSSGGPLVLLDGRVIGVNTAIKSRVRQSSGVGFAVPSNLIAKFAPRLITDGSVKHPYLGIAGTDLWLNYNQLAGLDPDLRGVIVSGVTPGSPADKAGIRGYTSKKQLDGVDYDIGGDVIIAIDGQPIRHFEQLLGYLFTKTEIGQEVTIRVLRDGKEMDLKATLDERPY